MAHQRNDFEISGAAAIVFLPSPVGIKPCLLDAIDLEAVLSFGRWRAAEFCKKSHKWYAYATKKHRNVYLHRFLVQPPSGLIVDHKNGDGLDNRRENIRAATESTNQYNRRYANKNSRTGLRGVSIEGSRYLARIDHKDKTVRLGLFDDPVTAAMCVELELIRRGLALHPVVLADNKTYTATSYESNQEESHV